MSDSDTLMGPDLLPENLEQLLASITPEIHLRLKSAVELGKWPDGSRLNETQLANSLQAVILYEAKYLPEEQRTGYQLPTGCGQPAGTPKPGVQDYTPGAGATAFAGKGGTGQDRKTS